MSEPRQIHAAPFKVDADMVKMLEDMAEAARRGEWTGVILMLTSPKTTWVRVGGKVPKGDALLLMEDFKHDFIHKRE